MVSDYFISLGKRLSGYLCGELRWDELDSAMRLSQEDNPFFTPYMQRRALEAICSSFLDEKALRQWSSSFDSPLAGKRIGIVMAGNIPLVGFHDLLCVMATGAEPVIKLSSKDSHLMPVLFPELDYCSAQELLSSKIDALITMGGDSAKAFYSSRLPGIPKLIRSSRFSAAVLSGDETDGDLDALCDDISLYYGLGCRSVTYLLISQSFDIEALAKRLTTFSNRIVNKTAKAIFLKNRAIKMVENAPFIPAEPFVFMETDEFFLPIGTIGYRICSSQDEIDSFIDSNKGYIQKIYRNFGSAQRPSLDDYPDGEDTIKFCLQIRDRL